jgi:hypothetical protein
VCKFHLLCDITDDFSIDFDETRYTGFPLYVCVSFTWVAFKVHITMVYPKVNEMYAYNSKHSLTSNTKDYVGKTH